MFIRKDDPYHGKTTHYSILEWNHESFATPSYDIRIVARDTSGNKIYLFISKEELTKLEQEQGAAKSSFDDPP